MAGQASQPEEKLEIERLGWRDTLVEIVTATLTSLGLWAMWGLEELRNAFFALLDLVNLKPWKRRGSAFPPGLPRKLRQPKTLTEQR
jgi:hypothetical protein